MKQLFRSLLIISMLTVIVMLFSPFASAEIFFDPLATKEYNLGDQFSLSGYVSSETEMAGILKVSLKCTLSEEDLAIRIYNFKQKEKIYFNEKATYLKSNSDKCKIVVSLNDLNKEIESRQSEEITFTKLLKGTVSLSKNKVKLGDKLNINGEILTLSGKKIEGAAKIVLQQENTKYLAVSSNIVSGMFTYIFEPNYVPPGEYGLSIKANDNFGNELQFAGYPVKIDSQIILYASLDKKEAIQGEKVSLKGELEGILAGTKAEVKIVVENASQSYALSTEKSFSQLIETDSLPAGSYKLTVSVKDAYGNTGESVLNLFVSSSPQSIVTSLNQISFKPQETLEMKAYATDLSGKRLAGSINVQMISEVEGKLLDKTIRNGSLVFVFPSSTKPSKITLRSFFTASDGKEVQKSDEIKMEEWKKIETALSGSILLIKNVGNVRFNEELGVQILGGRTYNIDKKINLLPGESAELDLADYLPTSNYSVFVPLEQKGYGNVSVLDNRPVYRKSVEEILGDMISGIKTIRYIMISLFALVAILALAMYFFNQRNRRYLWGLRNKLKKNEEYFGQKITEVEKENYFVRKENDMVRREAHLHKRIANELGKSLQEEKKEKQKFKTILEKSIGPEIAKELVSRDSSSHYGAKQEITVLFSDIRGFTVLAEKTDMWSVQTLLNKYFEHMARAIGKHKGVINKYIGDAIFAIFNAPVKIENHLLAAIAAALEMQKELHLFNEKLDKEGVKPIHMGIGINSGEAIIGSLGSSSRLEYTAIGDTVNLASRLEGEAKDGQILLTEFVYQKIKDKVKAEYVGIFHLKNVEKNVRVYNVVGLK
ncbi:MAG TPA: adenylate/guanylate cyclase domain-containing protein [Candidatus Nanoarchaeia archaeon]|nr:adenylate/guanylate cyclase domain-containing protein [Candidatus Nanoarchaeia archaeon]